MALFDPAILKPLAAKAPLLLKKVGQLIDGKLGDGDGVFEFSDVVDAVKNVVETIGDAI